MDILDANRSANAVMMVSILTVNINASHYLVIAKQLTQMELANAVKRVSILTVIKSVSHYHAIALTPIQMEAANVVKMVTQFKRENVLRK